MQEASLPSLPWIIVAIALAAAALVQTLRLAWTRALPGRRLRARVARAAEGEQEAEGLLRDLGFEITGRQVPHSFCVLVDGAPHDVDLRVDLLVERRGRRYVAEVKTGRVAPTLESAATRRQLLEYHHAAGADGILLVDADLGTVREITFPGRRGAAPRSLHPIAWILVGSALGAVAAWLLHA